MEILLDTETYAYHVNAVFYFVPSIEIKGYEFYDFDEYAISPQIIFVTGLIAYSSKS
jgi:hypothetical protein